jgi:hypothetical protein
VFLDYLKFIALINAQSYEYGRINLPEFLLFFIVVYTPSIIFCLNLLMPSQERSEQCVVFTGILCVLGFICGFLVMPLLSSDMYFAGWFIGIVSINCAIIAAIGSKVRKKLIGKKHRVAVSVLSVLAYFIGWSLYWFSR